MRVRLAVFAAGFLALTAPVVASAEPMDPALARLVENPSCRDDAGRFIPPNACDPDDRAFKRLVNQLGFAFAPTAMHSARTTGYGGLAITLEGAYTTISSDESYWKLGTQGSVSASDNRGAASNDDVSSLLQLYSLKLRKGFGFGLELTGSVGFMPRTSLLGGGADARFAVLEGFRTGILGIFPDIAVGAGVRTITGTPELQLTIAGLDIQISKPLPIQGASVLTPWLGYQYLWIFGDSGQVDLTPATDAQAYCGYAGINVPGNRDPNETEYDGQPICTSPDPNGHLDFNNNVVFDEARLERHRLLVGVNYRYEIVTAGAQLITDLVPPAKAQSSKEDEEILDGESRQWTFVLELGAHF
jgi:hypothetical protein